MTPDINKRIKAIQAGKVPAGYKKTILGIIPEDWNVKILNTFATHITEKNKNNTRLETLTNSATRGVVKQTDYFDKQISNDEKTDGYYIVRSGDYIYNPRISENAPCGPINQSHFIESGIVSPLYTVFRIKEKIHCDYYLEAFFKSSIWHRYMSSVANYGARHDRMNITNDDLFSMPILVPPIEEQRKIADILAAQDRIIEQKKKLIVEKVQRKNALAQILLSTDIHPKINVNNILIDKTKWSVKKFGDVFEFISTNSLSREFLSEEASECKNVHYGDILVKYTAILDASSADIPYVVKSVDCTKYTALKSGDIVIADTAEDYSAGKTVEIQNVANIKVIAGLHTMACRPNVKIFAPMWLGYYMNSNSYHDQLIPLITSMKVSSIAKKEIIKTQLMVPSLHEQEAIAKVLFSADEEIKLLQKNLEQEKLKKKSLMQLLLTGIVRVSA